MAVRGWPSRSRKARSRRGCTATPPRNSGSPPPWRGPWRTAILLYLDASSTAFHVAQALKGKRDLTIVTNALGVATELGGRHGNRLYLAGGELDERYRAFFDPTARAYLAQFRPGMAIVSTESVSPDAGFTDYHVGEGELCRQMIAQSRAVTMAVDASKFDRASIVAVASFAEVDRVVTDRAVDPAYAAVAAGVDWMAA
ncbi:DeoR/GlpR family DNA-binding transcription regulator [Sphingomonas panni]